MNRRWFIPHVSHLPLSLSLCLSRSFSLSVIGFPRPYFYKNSRMCVLANKNAMDFGKNIRMRNNPPGIDIEFTANIR
jgi:hypothetical protein